jgi:RNA polymerase primary sigma factor
LSEKESEVLGLYFGLNSKKAMSLEEIGNKLDLTRERVRQIKENATHKLRQATRSDILRSYLG